MTITYQVQYNSDKKRLWIHSSEGETVARFSVIGGIDIHRSIKDPAYKDSPCLYCSHTSQSTKEDLDFFCNKAKELWGVEIDKKKIKLEA